MDEMKKAVLLSVFAIAACGVAMAFEEIPRDAARALGVTKGKPFSSGLVFINGKFIDPPYVVERWGTGIRINSLPVTGQIVDWTEFIKTQTNVKQVKPSDSDAAPTSAAPPPPPAYTEKSDVDALDDLFDDDPKPAKSASRSAPSPVVRSTPRPKPPPTKYVLDGKFVKNDASKALVKRINDLRTEIDGILRRGGFIFFEENHLAVPSLERQGYPYRAAPRAEI